MNYKFDELWGRLRIAAFTVAALAFVFGSIYSHAKVIDVGLPVPQKEILKESAKAKEEEKADKKVNDYDSGKSNKKPSKSDREKSARHKYKKSA